METLPSYLKYGRRPTPLRQQMASEYALRPGVVIKKYAPDDDGSVSKKFWEYDVQCMIRQGHNGQLTPHTFPHCFVTSMFGSVADYHYWSPRIEERSKNEDGTTKDGGVKLDPESPDMGSNVLVLCANGQAGETTYIVGCIHHDLAAEPPKELGDGAYQEFQFNGVNVQINKDGDLTIERRGPTQVDGKPVNGKDDSKKGAVIKLDKEGAVSIATGDGKQTLKLDLQSGKIETVTDKGVKLGGDQKMVLGDKYTEAEDSFLTSLEAKLSTLVGLVTALTTVVGTGSALNPPLGSATSLVGNLVSLSVELPTVFLKFKTSLKTDVLSKKNTTE